MAETAGPTGATSHTSLESAQGRSETGARRTAAAACPHRSDDAALREALKRCSPATYEAARLIRITGDVEYLPAIVQGIIERFVEPDLKARLAHSDDDLRLIEDLGIDSLTLMEAVALAEDVLQISVDGELNHVRTLGDVRQLIARTLRESSPRPTAETPVGRRGPQGIAQFPSPWVPVRSPAEYQRLVGLSLGPKRLATENRDRSR